MWKNNEYIVNGKMVGKVWKRYDRTGKPVRYWAYGYTPGFVASSRQYAMRQVERMVRDDSES